MKLNFTSKPPQGVVPRQFRFDSDKKSLIQNEVTLLLNRGVVSKILWSPDLFVSNIFSRPKPNGRIRLIIDLTELNDHLEKEHFKMDHIEIAINMVTKGSYMASVDLKDAYFSIPLHKNFRKFVCFIWEGELFQFNCIPFGLSPAPRIFTKILKPLFSIFREQGHHGFSYIDDTFIWASDFLQCQRSLSFIIELFQKLGFTVNSNKSSLIPAHSMVFLGYIIDTERMEVRPTPEKISGVKEKIKKYLSSDTNWFKIRDVASILGTLVDLTKGVDYGLAHYKNLERCKIWGLILQKQNFNKFMKISRRGFTDLQWWWENIEKRVRKIRALSPDFEITTDASLLGWGGCVCQGMHRWSLEFRRIKRTH